MSSRLARLDLGSVGEVPEQEFEDHRHVPKFGLKEEAACNEGRALSWQPGMKREDG